MKKFSLVMLSLVLAMILLPAPSAAMIVDHTSAAEFENIPEEWIRAAKDSLVIAYGHTSHGSQLITGMNMIRTERGSLYNWSTQDINGALELRDYSTNFGGLQIANDLGAAYHMQSNYTAWEDATRIYLDQHPEVNVIIWSWCYQMTTYEENIVTYLTLMRQLEQDYPDVKFVYMTGRTNGQALCSEDTWRCFHNLRATQIRDFVNANNGILYDFADIESYDPDGNYFGDKLVTDNCDYDSNADNTVDRNWAIDWCNANSCLSCAGCAHSQCLNCYLKGKAAWWLWARLAGWDGSTSDPTPCTDDDWFYSDGDCSPDGTLIRNWNKINQACQGGVSHPSTESLACEYIPLAGDLNDDTSIDISDIMIVVNDFGKSGGLVNPRSDVNLDGRVDIADLVFVARRYTG